MREKVTSVLTVLAGFKNLLGFVLLLMMLILGNWTYGYPSSDLYDISRSWFNPSLAVDNDPEISKHLLSGYTRFFRSTETTNPLEANIDGRRRESDSITLIAKGLHEVEWKETRIEDVDLRIAEIKLNGRYYAMVRRYYSIGLREGFFYDILINRPLDQYPLNEKSCEEYFQDNHFGVLAPTRDPNVFEVVYKSDPKFAEYQSNTFAELANMYVANGSLYLSLRTEKPQPNTYMVFKLLDQKTLHLTCILLTTPSNSQIEAQSDILPAFAELKNAMHVMMGEECDCGALHAPGNALSALCHALDTVLYRPWACMTPPDWQLSSEDQTDRRRVVDENLVLWGHSDIWNYRKYRSYLSHLPGAEQEISRFYAEKFNLPEEDAGPLAYSAISYALAAGFDHGCIDDEANEHHRRGLNQGHSSSGFLPLMRHSRLFP